MELTQCCGSVISSDGVCKSESPCNGQPSCRHRNGQSESGSSPTTSTKLMTLMSGDSLVGHLCR